MMNRLTLGLLAPLFLVACAAPPEKEVALAPLDKDTVCVRESRTGTNLPTTRCRTAAQAQSEKDDLAQLEERRRAFRGRDSTDNGR